jgi:hypothetical protein
LADQNRMRCCIPRDGVQIAASSQWTEFWWACYDSLTFGHPK